jgi:hypothetical protein
MRQMLLRTTFLTLALLASACQFDPATLPPGIPDAPGAGDAGPGADAPLADAPLAPDAPLELDGSPAPDAPLPLDAASPDDAPPADAALPDAPPPDAAAPDAPPPVDAPVPDAALPDAPPPDAPLPPDAAPPDAAPPDAPPPGAACDDTQCQLGAFCCIRTTGPNTSYTCNVGPVCPSGSSWMCDGPEDCGGGTCCDVGAGSRCTFSACLGEVLCHGDGDCPQGLVCCPDAPYPTCAERCG